LWAPINAILVDPERSSTLYAAGPQGIIRSPNNGAHWEEADLPVVASVSALAADPAAPGRIWAASSEGLFQSDDGARTWQSPAALAQQVYTLVFDSQKPRTMYVGSYFKEGKSSDYPYNLVPAGGSIFVSRDGGTKFTKIPHDFGSGVGSIVPDPFDAGVLYVLTGSGGFRVVIHGTSLEGPVQKLGDFKYFYSLVADPVRPGRLYATTDLGVQRSIDGGRTWHPFSSGLGSLGAWALAITPDGRRLHLGSLGGGVFELDLEPAREVLPPPDRDLRPRTLPRGRPDADTPRA
jgi:hypothetical protein